MYSALASLVGAVITVMNVVNSRLVGTLVLLGGLTLDTVLSGRIARRAGPAE